MLKVGQALPKFSIATTDGSPFTDAQLSDKAGIVKFTRYLGCPVCQYDLVTMANEYETVRKAGLALTVFIESTPQEVSEFVNARAVPYRLVGDKQRVVYAAFGATPGTIKEFLHPGGALAFAKATAHGYMHGKFSGKETQVPAEFLVDSGGVIRFVRRGKHVGDTLSVVELAQKATELGLK